MIASFLFFWFKVSSNYVVIRFFLWPEIITDAACFYDKIELIIGFYFKRCHHCTVEISRPHVRICEVPFNRAGVKNCFVDVTIKR